jgi:acetoin utilization deacetylase AcuC-like enzyme
LFAYQLLLRRTLVQQTSNQQQPAELIIPTTLPLIKIAYDPIYAHPLPEGHRFPMLKYELIPAQLLHEGSITTANLFSPKPCPEEVILWTHDKTYVDKLVHQNLSASEQRKIGFPQLPKLTERELIITQGTIDCCHYAFENGVALNVAGGTHHAFADRGEGFCLLNDFAVAANYLLKKKLAAKILIIDLDVHQGNGTAKLFENEERVFTFSVHGQHNYPFHKDISDLDVPLKDGIGDEEYLAILKEQLPLLVNIVKPDFAFYLSGVDILETDKFGKLKVTMNGCKQRDEMVFTVLKSNHIPCAVAMGGGYSADVKLIVEAHCNTYRTAISMYG